ncbi:hypothetical protein ACT691_01190, partial [Vibrio metschnikovii]
MLLPPRSGLTPLSDDAFKLSRWSTAETLLNLNDEGNLTPALATEWHRLTLQLGDFSYALKFYFMMVRLF